MMTHRRATFIAKYGLSFRQSEVLEIACEGLSISEMADRLHISEATIKWHISHLLARFEVKSRVQLIAKVANNGGI